MSTRTRTRTGFTVCYDCAMYRNLCCEFLIGGPGGASVRFVLLQGLLVWALSTAAQSPQSRSFSVFFILLYRRTELQLFVIPDNTVQTYSIFNHKCKTYSTFGLCSIYGTRTAVQYE